MEDIELDPTVSSYQLAVISLNLWVRPSGKSKSVDYRTRSSEMLKSKEPANNLLACITYILLVKPLLKPVDNAGNRCLAR